MTSMWPRMSTWSAERGPPLHASVLPCHKYGRTPYGFRSQRCESVRLCLVSQLVMLACEGKLPFCSLSGCSIIGQGAW